MKETTREAWRDTWRDVWPLVIAVPVLFAFVGVVLAMIFGTWSGTSHVAKSLGPRAACSYDSDRSIYLCIRDGVGYQCIDDNSGAQCIKIDRLDGR